MIHWHGPVFGEVAQPLTSLALNRYVRGHWPSSIFFPSTHAIPAAATQPGLHRQRRAHTSTNQQRGRMGWPGLYGQVYRKLAATCSTGSTSIILHHCCVPKGVPSSSVGISPLAHMLHISGTWSAMIGQDSELLLGLKQPQVLMLLHSTGSSSFYCTRQQRVCTP